MARERTSNRREFLQLAHVFDPAKHSVAGWYMSEKMDGQRCYWDGGITRGLYADEVPFANVAKDGRLVSRPKCTGLWSRYGKPIQGPLWFLDELPKYPLDGELTMGRGTFQALMSTCRKLVPDDAAWERVHYYVFDLPDYSQVFRPGVINVPNFEKEITGVIEWLHMQKICKWKPADAKLRRFETVQYLLQREHPSDGTGIVKALHQQQLPFSTPKALEVIDATMQEIVAAGAEGLILRNHNSIWEPQRSHNLLKVKPYLDEEATVRNYIWGRETDRGSKLLGLMGAMVVDFRGLRLELSGFTDAERQMAYHPSVDTLETPAKTEGERNPGQQVSTLIHNPMFPIGSKVTIRYRELTKDGIPKEARFWRQRPAGE